MWLFLLFIAVPLIEIALFIQVGGWIGLWPTLAVVVLTAIIGTYLVRRQGLRALEDLRRAFEELGDPARPLAHGAMILFAGALLLTPGFFTDSVGVLLLIPAVRDAVLHWLARRVRVETFAYGTRPKPTEPPGDVIEGEYRELPPGQRPTHRPGGSTRH
ncbi:MAG: FxsA family protein [Paracoccaceae bacterium]|nr:FxsA family protein [Paracoccaceae bacterium]